MPSQRVALPAEGGRPRNGTARTANQTGPDRCGPVFGATPKDRSAVLGFSGPHHSGPVKTGGPTNRTNIEIL